MTHTAPEMRQRRRSEQPTHTNDSRITTHATMSTKGDTHEKTNLHSSPKAHNRAGIAATGANHNDSKARQTDTRTANQLVRKTAADTIGRKAEKYTLAVILSHAHSP